MKALCSPKKQQKASMAFTNHILLLSLQLVQEAFSALILLICFGESSNCVT